MVKEINLLATVAIDNWQFYFEHKSNQETVMFRFLLFSSPDFRKGLRGPQLQIQPPHVLLDNQHRLLFARIKSQTVPTKILDIIELSCS